MTGQQSDKFERPELHDSSVAHIHNEDIAVAFEEMADLLALSGDNPFRIRAYRRAAQLVRSLPQELEPRISHGFDPDALPGIGADLSAKIRELIDTGRCQALERLRRSVPAGLRELLKLPGIGPQRARTLFDALKIHSLKDLQHALETQQVRHVPGFGVKSEASLHKALAQAGQHSRRLPWYVARQYAIAIRHYLAALPGVTRVELAGSFRRGRETVGDLDIVMCADVDLDLHAALRSYGETASTLVAGPTRCSIVLRSGLQVDVRLVPAASFGAALYYLTGSKAHNIHVRRIAMSQGLKVNEYGVFRGKARIAGDSEASVFASVGLPFIAPELREDRGEIEAALVDNLPVLIERDQLRGDLHVHTRNTDGTAALADMAAAAHRAGLQYIAITDHAKHIGIVHGLDASALARQIDEIDAFNADQTGCTILKGIEVDILQDGSLALPDSVLQRLDVVVAAVHDHFGLSRRRQTGRLLRALDHRSVSILAHPSTRLIEERPGIDCDWHQVLQRAAQRPCYMELNAQPARLDLDDIMVREAAELGVLISIASDAHGTDDFPHLELGVLQARRGWLSAAQVLNTRGTREVRRLLRSTFL